MESIEAYENQEIVNTKGRAWRVLALVVIAALFIVLMILNITTKPSLSEQAWDARTTLGSLEAKNYYIMYTDLMCPYCDVFSREAMNHQEEFEQFLADNDILFEVRMTDFLYEGHGEDLISSRDAAEGVYCATREDKFWEYYHQALQNLWDDYHSKGIGVSKTATPIGKLPDNYWLKAGHQIGLGEQFDNCMQNHETLAEITKNTGKAAMVADGMPYFRFNKFITSGFDNNWGWDYVKMYLQAGLEA